MFKDMLESSQTLFKNEDSLDPEWVPKLLPHRERQQFSVANCIKPLTQGRNGINILIYGTPGIGKTAAIKWVLRDLEENTDEIYSIYINCWQKNTSYKILCEICTQLNYSFTQNKNTDELFDVVKNIVNKKSAVFVFDEIDKLEEINFLYNLINEVYKKTIILITNYKEWYLGVEDRLKSRLLPENIEFKAYNKPETKDILTKRIDYAFFPEVWDEDAINFVVDNSYEAKDIRVGLKLLRSSGLVAESFSSKKVFLEHAKKAVENLELTKDKDDLDQDERIALSVIKESPEEKIGDLFKKYQEKGGSGTYKSFQRKIEHLEKGKFIKTKKFIGGKEGTTTIVQYTKSLTEY
ncbi:AAA family ATPase [Candidatus Woesearchaeota archaeon]|nr:AAA family ATPase [Candidatus Woesearchaeota archaeon]